jgi:hypothetical protein
MLVRCINVSQYIGIYAGLTAVFSRVEILFNLSIKLNMTYCFTDALTECHGIDSFLSS